jgi:hypothetical protein
MPSEMAGFEINGDNRKLTLIQNVSRVPIWRNTFALNVEKNPSVFFQIVMKEA